MLSFLRKAGRLKGKKKRKSRRGIRTANLVAPAVITTAILIPLISDLFTGSDYSGNNSTAAATTDGSSSSSSTSGSSSGSTGDMGTFSDSESSSGSSVANDTATDGGNTTGGDGGVSSGGSYTQFVLALDQESPDSSTAGSSTDSGTGNSDSTASSNDSTTDDTNSAWNEYSGGDIMQIEEDWELNITEPDPTIAAPQVVTVMTPFENASDFYMAFAVNHRFNPSNSTGGMELQLWYQGEQMGWLSVDSGLLSTSDEKINWTQRLEIKNCRLRFSVVNGTSTTWGSFGQGESMHMSIATTLSDLNYYRPKTSAGNSGISYASNRVGNLVLKSVRGYNDQGNLVLEDSAPMTVYAQPE